MRLTRVNETLSKTQNPDWYTGAVWSNELAVGEAARPLHAVLVTFEPAARTAWHTHPFGQILIAVSGSGRVQLAGESARVLNPGDTVTIAPGERHWHGAAPGQVFAHISMQAARPDGTMADWSDRVTDEEYGQPTYV